MTKEEIEKKITELENEIIFLRQSVEEYVTPTPPHQRPELKRGDVYYYITSDGLILSKTWCDDSLDNERCAIGNVFITYESAKYAAEYYKVLAEMRKWAGSWDDPWRITYCNGDIEPTAVFLGHELSYGEIRFANESNAKNCIKTVGEDRLKTYYFRIRNNKIPMPDCCCCSS